MKKATVGLLAVLASMGVAGSASAQLVPNLTPFSVEVRGGVAVPTGDLKDIDAETGFGFGGSITYHVLPMIGIYGGYSRNEFEAPDLLGDDAKYIDNGFDAGVRVGIPTPLLPIDPFVKAGLVYHKLDGQGFTVGGGESDSGLGFEVGAGLGFGLGPKVSITPGVSYTSYSPEDNGASDFKVSHIKADVGLRIRL